MMGQATKHGAFLAIALGMALGLRQWVAVGLIAAGVLLTNSSFTWLSAAGAVLVWARYEWGRRVVIVLSVSGLLSAALLFLVDSSLTVGHGRFDVWQAAILAWWNGPWVMGYGLGSFAAAVGPNQTFFAQAFQPAHLKVYGDFLQAHNDYVQVVFETGMVGIIGMAAGLYFIGSYYCRVWWQRELNKQVIVAAECGLVAILLNAIGNFPSQLAPHYLLAVIFVALLMDKTNKGYNKL
jgi:O-antigen ligase